MCSDMHTGMRIDMFHGHVYVHVYGRLWMDMCIYMRIDMCIDKYIEQGEVHRHVRARVCVPSAGLPRAYA